jgi:hypothetical protein
MRLRNYFEPPAWRKTLGTVVIFALAGVALVVSGMFASTVTCRYLDGIGAKITRSVVDAIKPPDRYLPYRGGPI